jgi:hypothetical protein
VLETIKVHGLPVVREPLTIHTFQKIDDFKKFLRGLSPDRIEPIIQSYAGDSLHMNLNGYLTTGGPSPIKLTDRCLARLLHLLGLPLSMCFRLDTLNLVNTVNALLESYGRRLYFRLTNNQSLAVGVSTMEDFRSTYTLLDSFLFEPEHPRADFVMAATDMNQWMVILSTTPKDEKDPTIGGLEILMSDEGSVRPTITGFVGSPSGHMLIRDLTFKVEKGVNFNIYWNRMQGAFVETKVRINDWVAKHKKLGERKLDEDDKVKITDMANRMLKQPLDVSACSNMSDVLGKLRPLRKDAVSIDQKRQINYFAGALLSL